jgi:UDP-N-acetylglucosamine 4,6-dehydratase/5-epimerase
VIQPAQSWWRKENWKNDASLPEGFRYSSDSNSQWLMAEDLYKLVEGSAPPVSLHGETPVRASA